MPNAAVHYLISCLVHICRTWIKRFNNTCGWPIKNGRLPKSAPFGGRKASIEVQKLD